MSKENQDNGIRHRHQPSSPQAHRRPTDKAPKPTAPQLRTDELGRKGYDGNGRFVLVEEPVRKDDLTGPRSFKRRDAFKASRSDSAWEQQKQLRSMAAGKGPYNGKHFHELQEGDKYGEHTLRRGDDGRLGYDGNGRFEYIRAAPWELQKAGIGNYQEALDQLLSGNLPTVGGNTNGRREYREGDLYNGQRIRRDESGQLGYDGNGRFEYIQQPVPEWKLSNSQLNTLRNLQLPPQK